MQPRVGAGARTRGLDGNLTQLMAARDRSRIQGEPETSAVRRSRRTVADITLDEVSRRLREELGIEGPGAFLDEIGI